MWNLLPAAQPVSPRARPWMIAALVLCLLPMAMLVILGVGEMAGGIVSGLQHFVQLLPLALLTAFAWRRPRVGGLLLAAIAGVLMVAYVVLTTFNAFALINAAMLFGGPLVAGILFVFAARMNAAAQTVTAH